MYIGKVEQLTGASQKAIRHYEQLGFFTAARQGTYRVYSDDHIRLICFIKTAQSMGFSLKDIKDALEAGKGAPNWHKITAALKERKHHINQQISELNHQAAKLDEHIHVIERCLQDDPNCSENFY